VRKNNSNSMKGNCSMKKLAMMMGISMLVALTAACNVTYKPIMAEEGLGLEAHAKRGDEKEHRIVEAAGLRILRQLDGGDFGGVWDASSPLMRQSLDRATFTNVLEKDKVFMGKAVGRQLIFSGFVDGSSGGVSGRHAVLIYQTEFRGTSYEEKVLMALDSKGTWIPAGYFYKPEE
jgi:Protein of unknown function (DUF4019)